MGHDRMLTVFCICRESDWQALKPSFDKALLTMQRGEKHKDAQACSHCWLV